MKKIFTLACGAALFAGTAFAQTVEHTENFDSYATDAFIAEEGNIWKTWSEVTTGEAGSGYGTEEDAKVSADEWVSWNKSLYLQSLNGQGPTDLLWDFSETTFDEGYAVLDLNMFVVDGTNGYFNIQGLQEVGDNGVWTLSMYFTDRDSIVVQTTAGAFISSTTYAHEEWFNFRIEANLDEFSWTLYINGNQLEDANGPVSLQVPEGMAAINLYPSSRAANPGAGGADSEFSRYYLDDLRFAHFDSKDDAANTEYETPKGKPTKQTGSIFNAEVSKLNIFPNPVNDVINVSLANAVNNGTLTITDMNGKVVSNEVINATNGHVVTINTAALATGAYMITLNNEGAVSTTQFVKH